MYLKKPYGAFTNFGTLSIGINGTLGSAKMGVRRMGVIRRANRGKSAF